MVGAGIVYGRRGEVYESRNGSLGDFITSTFEIEDVFKNKLVMGRCICHGKKTLETDVLLDDEQEAAKFIFSHELSKPHILLIYDKHGDLNMEEAKEADTEEKEEKNIVISEVKWNELVSSIKNLESSLKVKQDEDNGETSEKINTPLHANIFCDGCTSPHDEGAQEIRGSRYKCLTCTNFDLCSECEEKGYENLIHKKNHNMIKIKTPAFLDIQTHSKHWGRIRQQSKLNDDKEITIDIPENEKELFDMFSDLDKLKAIADGYKCFVKWVEEYRGQENVSKILLKSSERGSNPCTLSTSSTSSTFHLPKSVKRKHHAISKTDFSAIKVKLTRKDTTLFFKLSNKGGTVIPSGLTLIYYIQDVRSSHAKELRNNECELEELCKLPMGPHELLVGQEKTLRFNFYPRAAESSVFEGGIIKVIDADDQLVYQSTKHDELGSSFILKGSDETSKLSRQLQSYLHLDSSADTCRLLEKDESDGVISSNITNDDETVLSVSSRDTNWEEYDFLSESDV